MNSIQNPLRIAWIEDGPPRCPGRLGLTIAPGKKGQGHELRHDRDLTTDLGYLKEQGVTLLVNLMQQDEMQRWHMDDYHAEAARLGLNVRHHPIPDVKTPTDDAAFHALVQDLRDRLRHGETIVIHCLGGLGRSGMLAACLLVQSGLNAHDAIALVRHCRGPRAVEADQPRYVETYARTHTC
ncbi:protein-tyrosine-phosphatase [Deinococcus cavernae]|uniref:protein-tyrosine-phosphatase n=1 Tax=Deinococcus cavernae TaxID=2320857 RepID=A0A418V8F4_9DEIO|nr:cyclin-dependent kinase inhibitor 3 family protein [Deinococcus cavernae]RJF72361.1 protein-tyrosine-phosphatase [Deinococcus cavernae]